MRVQRELCKAPTLAILSGGTCHCGEIGPNFDKRRLNLDLGHVLVEFDIEFQVWPMLASVLHFVDFVAALGRDGS